MTGLEISKWKLIQSCLVSKNGSRYRGGGCTRQTTLPGSRSTCRENRMRAQETDYNVEYLISDLKRIMTCAESQESQFELSEGGISSTEQGLLEGRMAAVDATSDEENGRSVYDNIKTEWCALLGRAEPGTIAKAVTKVAKDSGSAEGEIVEAVSLLRVWRYLSSCQTEGNLLGGGQYLLIAQSFYRFCREQKQSSAVIMPIIVELYQMHEQEGNCNSDKTSWNEFWVDMGKSASVAELLHVVHLLPKQTPLSCGFLRSVLVSCGEDQEKTMQTMRKLQDQCRKSLLAPGYVAWVISALECDNIEEMDTALENMHMFLSGGSLEMCWRSIIRHLVDPKGGISLGGSLSRTEERCLSVASKYSNNSCTVLEVLDERLKRRNVLKVLKIVKKLRAEGLIGEPADGGSCDGFFRHFVLKLEWEPPILPSITYNRLAVERHAGFPEQAKLGQLYERILRCLQDPANLSLLDQVFGMALHDKVPITRQMIHIVSMILPSYPPRRSYEFYCFCMEQEWIIDALGYKGILKSIIRGPETRGWWKTCMHILHRCHVSLPFHIETNLHTSLVVLCGRFGWYSEMMELYNLMLQDGVEPNVITWNAFIASSNKLDRPTLGLAFYEAMKKSDALMDTSTYSSVLSCYASVKNVPKATMAWNDMLRRKVRPDSVVCNSYIWACLEGGDPETALQVFLQWRKEGTPPGWKDVEPNTLVYFSEIQEEYAFLGKMTMRRKALRIQRWLRSIGVKPESLKLQDLEERSKKESDRVWIQAFKLARPFLPPNESELSPTAAAYSYAILACKRLGQQTDLAFNLARELASIEFSNSPVEFAAAIGACAAINSLEVALSILKKANASGVSLSHHSFTSALAICAEVEDVSSALWILREMKSSGIKPNAYTMNCVLSVCSTTGRVAGALKLFKSLEPIFEVKPDVICFATMWEMLGKYDRWSDALTFFLVAENVLDSRAWPFLFLGGQRRSHEEVLPLDLHNLSTIGASVVLRGWILLLFNRRMNRKIAKKNSFFVVITGTGKSSHDGQSKLKPSVLRTLHSIFRKRDGAHFDESHPGQIQIPKSLIDKMKESEIERLGLGNRDQQETILAFLNGHESASMNDIQMIR